MSNMNIARNLRNLVASQYRPVLFIAISMASNLLFPLLAIPFMSRSLGPEEFGKFVLVQSLVIIVMQIVDFGFSITGVRDISKHSGRPGRVSATFKAIQAGRLIIVISLLLGIALLQLFSIIRFSENTFLALISSALLGLLTVPFLFSGLQRFGWVAAANFLGKAVYFAAFVFLSQAQLDLTVSISILIISNSTTAAVYLIGMRALQINPFAMGKLYQGLRIIRKSARTFLAVSALNLHSNFLIAAVGYFLGAASAGVFSTTDRIIRAAASITAPITIAYLPRYSQKVSIGETGLSRERRTLLAVLLSVGALSALTIFLFAGTLSEIFLPASSGQLYENLLILAVVPLIIPLSQIYGGIVLISLREDAKYLNSILFSELIGVTIFLALVFWMPVYAGAGTILATELSMSVVMCVLAMRRLRAIGL